MAVLNWGECDIFHAKSTDGAAPATKEGWTELPTPKEDSTTLASNEGTDKEAREEGGAIVDFLPVKNSYTLEFDLYMKKGETDKTSVQWLLEAADGVVPGEHAFRVEGQDKGDGGSDKGTWCVLVERAAVKVTDSFTTADGSLLHVKATALKPKEGNTIKYYEDPKTKYADI